MDENITCDFQGVMGDLSDLHPLSWGDKCSLIECTEEFQLVDFIHMFLCTLNGNYLAFGVIAFFTILIIFRFMCDVVDEYVGESIVYITKWLKMSEALAGVTLLALANGAGDLITAIVSAESEEGVNYNIGALFGAGLFVITIVLTFTIKNASEKPIRVDPECIYRDVLMYILGVLTVISFGIYGYLTWWTSCIMLLEYVALVATVVY